MASDSSRSKSENVQIPSHGGVVLNRCATPTSSDSGITELELRFREVIVMWLRWNEAYEQATTQLLSAGMSAKRIEDFMDSMDRLRREAVALSHSLLD